MSYAGLTWKDIAESSLAIGLIFAFLFWGLARVGAAEWRRPIRMTMEVRIPTPVASTQYDQGVTIDWTSATSQERAQAVLGVLPLHYEDSNGITATDVAHRLGIGKASRVIAALNTLMADGRARGHWEMHRGHKRRCYWRTGSPPR